MTEWRDARLQRALDAAPDAGARPAPATRAAVREAARQAVQSSKWWKRAWWPTPQQRMPWNAAFATVLVGVLIALLWQGEEVPDAVPAASRLDPPVPAAQAPAAPLARPQAASGAAAPRARAAETARKPAPPAPPPERRAAAGGTAAKDAVAPASPPPPPAPPVEEAPAPPPAAAAARAPAPAPEATADAASPRSAGPPLVKAAPRREFAAQMQAPDWRAWTQVRIESEGRAVVLARAQAAPVAQLVGQLARAALSSEPLALLPQVKLELSHQGVLLGVLEIAGDQVRWSAPQMPGPSRTARPDPAQLQALREEARRALAR